MGLLVQMINYLIRVFFQTRRRYQTDSLIGSKPAKLQTVGDDSAVSSKCRFLLPQQDWIGRGVTQCHWQKRKARSRADFCTVAESRVHFPRVQSMRLTWVRVIPNEGKKSRSVKFVNWRYVTFSKTKSRFLRHESELCFFLHVFKHFRRHASRKCHVVLSRFVAFVLFVRNGPCSLFPLDFDSKYRMPGGMQCHKCIFGNTYSSRGED